MTEADPPRFSLMEAEVDENPTKFIEESKIIGSFSQDVTRIKMAAITRIDFIIIFFISLKVMD
jgi:hypothetical protein